MCHMSADPEPMYTREYEDCGKEVLGWILGMSVNNITHNNCKDVYIQLLLLLNVYLHAF